MFLTEERQRETEGDRRETEGDRGRQKGDKRETEGDRGRQKGDKRDRRETICSRVLDFKTRPGSPPTRDGSRDLGHGFP